MVYIPRGIIAFICHFGTLVENLYSAGKYNRSIFYGNVLGIFLIAFFIKFIKGNAVFWAAVITQLIVILLYYFTIHIYDSGDEKLGYLWLNFIGCALVILLATLFQTTGKLSQRSTI